MAFAVSRSVGTTRAYGVCLKAPVLPRLRHGKAVQREVPTVAPPSALANDQESVAPASMWSRTKDFMSSKAPKLFAALMLAAVLMISTPGASEAARSGGRMGGSGFSAGRSFSSGGMGATSRSFGGSMGGSSLGGSTYRSYNRPGTVVNHHTTVVRPGFGWGFGAPMGMYSAGPVMVAGDGGGGGGIFTLLVLGIFAFVAYQAFTGGFGGDDYEELDDPDNAPMSVVKIQVGLLGTARELQRDLNRMGNSVDTSTPGGLHYLLQETVLALRRNPQYAMYGKAELNKTRGLDNAEAGFNKVSMEERGKFQKETLSNVGGRTNRSVAKVDGDGMSEMIVVTIIAAVDGKLTPGDMQSQDDLKTNLDLLGSIPSDRLLALEVLWTPQDENDYFTKEELVTDYPTLNML